MSCKPTYKGIRYDSLEELYKANGVNLQQKQQAQQKFQEYVNITGKQDIEGFKEFVGKQSSNIFDISKLGIVNLTPQDLDEMGDFNESPKIKVEGENINENDSFDSILSYLEKELEFYNLRVNSTKNREDKKRYKDRVKDLEIKIADLKESKSIDLLINFAKVELERVRNELSKGKQSAEGLEEIIRVTSLYSKFESLMLSPELVRNYPDSSLVKDSKNISEQAKELYVNQIQPLMLEFVKIYANEQLGLKLKFEDIFKYDPTGRKIVFKDTWVLQSLSRPISTTGGALDSIIQISIDDTNSKADDKLFKEYTELDKEFDKFKKSNFYKKYGNKGFIDEEGNLIKRFNNSYYQKDSELASKFKNASNFSAVLKSFSEYQDYRTTEGFYVDIRKLYKQNADGTISFISNDAYISELKNKTKSNNIDYILRIVEKRVKAYEEQFLLEQEEIENDEDLDGAVKAAKLDLWVKTHSPFEMLNGLDSKTYSIRELGKTRIKYGYTYLYNVPNPKHLNEDFDKIINDSTAENFYDYLTQKLNDYYDKAPDRNAEGLSYNYLSYVPMSLMEELNEKGLFSTMKHGLKLLFDNITEKNPPVVFEEVDPVTQKLKYSLKYPISNPNRFLTQEEIDFKNRNRSFDLEKIMKYTAGKAITYEYKREIESPLKIIEAIYQNSYEQNSENNEMLISKDGLHNRRAAATYAITKQLYNIDPKNKYNLESRKKLLKAEEELKFAMEQRLKEENKNLETLNKEIESLPENSKEISKMIKKKKALEYQISKYEKNLENFLANYGRSYSTDAALTANMKYTQLLGMGYNLSGAFANLFSAGIGNAIEGAGGENFTTFDFRRAFGIMLNSSANITPGAIGGGILGSLLAPGIGTVIGAGFGTLFSSGNFTGTGKKINSLMNRFKILGNIIDSRSYERDFLTGEKKWYQKLSPYHLYTMSEYFSQGITMVAILLNKKINVKLKGSDQTEEISLWDAFDKNGNWENKYEKSDSWDTEGLDFITTKRNIEQVRDKVHGNYSTPTRMQGNIFGKMASQYRRWMFETVANRIESERPDYKLDPEGRTVEGRYRIYFNKDNETGAISVNLENMKRVIKETFFLSRNKKYSDLKNYEQANLQRNVKELQSFIALMVLYYAFKYMNDDDEESYAANVILNSLFRISDDLEFYLNPMSFESLTSQVAPSLNTVTKAADVLNYSLRVMADDTFLDPAFRNVSDKKFNVLGKKIARIIPASNTAFTVNRVVTEVQDN